MGITRNANVIPYHKLEHHVRAHLDATSPRTLMVLRPLKVGGLVGGWVTPGCVCPGDAMQCMNNHGFASNPVLLPQTTLPLCHPTRLTSLSCA